MATLTYKEIAAHGQSHHGLSSFVSRSRQNINVRFGKGENI